MYVIVAVLPVVLVLPVEAALPATISVLPARPAAKVLEQGGEVSVVVVQELRCKVMHAV